MYMHIWKMANVFKTAACTAVPKTWEWFIRTVPQEVQSSCKGPGKWPRERTPSPLWASIGLVLALLLDVVCMSLEKGPIANNQAEKVYICISSEKITHFKYCTCTVVRYMHSVVGTSRYCKSTKQNITCTVIYSVQYTWHFIKLYWKIIP